MAAPDEGPETRDEPAGGTNAAANSIVPPSVESEARLEPHAASSNSSLPADRLLAWGSSSPAMRVPLRGSASSPEPFPGRLSRVPWLRIRRRLLCGSPLHAPNQWDGAFGAMSMKPPSNALAEPALAEPAHTGLAQLTPQSAAGPDVQPAKATGPLPLGELVSFDIRGRSGVEPAGPPPASLKTDELGRVLSTTAKSCRRLGVLGDADA